MKIVIRAGGVGSRLWPVSRLTLPKQFQKLVGQTSMLQDTFARLAGLVEPSDVFVSINQSLRSVLKKQLPSLPARNVIAETASRNTGPAICLEVASLSRRFTDTEIIASIPSDDYISHPADFRQLLRFSARFLRTQPDYVITPAVKPKAVDVGYTYFKVGAPIFKQGKDFIAPVDKVIEKPDRDRCRLIIALPQYYCHTGMYVWQLGHIARLFAEHQPRLWAACQKIAALIEQQAKTATIAKHYGQLEKISIESAITDKLQDKLVVAVAPDLVWSDLGKWQVIKKVLEPKDQANLTKGLVEVRAAKNNLVYNTVPGKIIVINDVDNLAIIDTPDALFISSLHSAHEVKEIVEKLKREGKTEFI